MEHSFSWFTYIPGLNQIPVELVCSMIALLILTVMAFVIHHKLKRVEDYVIPSNRFSLLNIMEMIVEALLGMLRANMGEHAENYLPLIGTTFLVILITNLLGLIPGFISATSNVNINLGMALVVMVASHYYGVREHGGHYFKRFMGPVGWLALLFIAIETISLVFVIPISLSLRLYGNMTGDHTVLHIFSNLIPLFIPMIFMAMGIFVSFLQAVIFSLLASVYIGNAISHDH